MLYVKLYSWYVMPPTVHKVLIHGADIMKAVFVPVGQLSEESQEASNKYFKKARLFNSRTFNQAANNEDIFHHLLISSDPVISNLRKIEKPKIDLKMAAVEQLLLNNN